MFTAGGSKNRAGYVYTNFQKGGRLIIAEVQGLVVASNSGSAKKMVRGMDQSRISLLAAVIEKHLEIPILQSDLFLNILFSIIW